MKDEDIVNSLVKGKMRWYEVEDRVNGDNSRATELRRKAVEKIAGVSLGNIAHHSIDMKRAMKANIENSIGVVQIPMGIVGPLTVNGEHAKGEFLVPLATTEGALVASVSRGVSVINQSGGATSTIIEKGTTRGPILTAETARDAREVAEWVSANKEWIKQVSEETDPNIRFKDVTTKIIGRNLFFRFVYDTGDAMGMNMVTVATDKTLAEIEKKFETLKHVSLSGNYCVDKKAAALTLILGRGFYITSEVVIPKKLIKSRLKTTADRIVEVAYRKNLLGSAAAGSYGFNAHFANMIGAVFLATGQDEAHIVEGSHGFTLAEVLPNGDVYFSVTLPSLMVGTIGGGTGVDTQREALSIMGVAGGAKELGANSKKFAEIVAAVVLAGEISLAAAVSARHLTQSHVRLNR